MKAKAILYQASGMQFLKIENARKDKPYSLRYIESLAGFKLHNNAAQSLYKFGFIRVCEDSGSYRIY